MFLDLKRLNQLVCLSIIATFHQTEWFANGVCKIKNGFNTGIRLDQLS